MAKKKSKKKLPDALLDLKQDSDSEISVNSEELDLDLSDLDAVVGGDVNKTVKMPPPHPATNVGNDGEKTFRLIQTSATDLKGLDKKNNDEKEDPPGTKISYGMPSKQSGADRNMASVESTLKQSEHLRIAQNKINSLEEELEKLRRENEELASAGETFKRINEEYYASIESLKMKVGDQKQTYGQELELLRKIGQSKDKQIVELKQQIDDLNSRIDNNFRRVRKREKDLEHRLEIAKIEEAAVVKSKDQLILDLKRRIDEISSESDNFRKKSQENYKELQKKQQVVRGVIRALRIALTKLEGDDESDFGIEGSAGSGNDQDS
ncbi:MAG: hypothetical protein HRT44_01340 [Bdellovibrionales bacterium]|nr:hypothetical protein [Bdellovibrionales bacterium]NQZ17891.1 hypothetical protein [Bdellovibrionales bacterium]